MTWDAHLAHNPNRAKATPGSLRTQERGSSVCRWSSDATGQVICHRHEEGKPAMDGLGDMVNQAKDMVPEGATDAAVDQAAEAAKNIAPDAADSAIDAAADKAKDMI